MLGSQGAWPPWRWTGPTVLPSPWLPWPLHARHHHSGQGDGGGIWGPQESSSVTSKRKAALLFLPRKSPPRPPPPLPRELLSFHGESCVPTMPTSCPVPGEKTEPPLGTERVERSDKEQGAEQPRTPGLHSLSPHTLPGCGRAPQLWLLFSSSWGGGRRAALPRGPRPPRGPVGGLCRLCPPPVCFTH